MTTPSRLRAGEASLDGADPDRPWLFQHSSAWQGLHYLDSAATSQLLGVAHDAMRDFEQDARANVRRGIHRLADEADARYEAARAVVATFLDATPDEVVFTSGATAALNQLAASLSLAWQAGDEVLVTALEHHSNWVPWQMAAERTGARLRCLPVDGQGALAVDQLSRFVSPRTRVIAVTQMSNVTGAITDLAPLAAAAQACGACLVVDAAQAAAHGLPRPPEADFVVLAGHKLHGPTGIGVLWGRRERLAQLPPAWGGGGMVSRVSLQHTTWAPVPARLEAGTPPFVQAVGLAAALRWHLSRDRASDQTHQAALMAVLRAGLAELPAVRVIGTGGPGLVSWVMAGLHPHDVTQALDACGVLVRGGHLCAQPLMQALGLPGVVRASLARHNTMTDVLALMAALHQLQGELA